MRIILAVFAIISTIMMPNIINADDTPRSGTYRATVLKVVEADMVKVNVELWPDLFKTVLVRLTGIDTPESRGTSCKALYGGSSVNVPVDIKRFENEQGRAASQFMASLLEEGDSVVIAGVKRDKFSGRVAARLADAAGQDIGQSLIEAGFAVPYAGGTMAGPWCHGPEPAE